MLEATIFKMLDDEVSLDEIIAESKKTGGIFKEHLKSLIEEFRRSADAKSLANSFRGLADGKPLDSEEIFDAMLALGVVTGTYSGDAVIRSELYKTWLPPRIPR